VDARGILFFSIGFLAVIQQVTPETAPFVLTNVPFFTTDSNDIPSTEHRISSGIATIEMGSFFALTGPVGAGFALDAAGWVGFVFCGLTPDLQPIMASMTTKTTTQRKAERDFNQLIKAPSIWRSHGP
jgi:hypothetical protein